MGSPGCCWWTGDAHLEDARAPSSLGPLAASRTEVGFQHGDLSQLRRRGSFSGPVAPPPGPEVFAEGPGGVSRSLYSPALSFPVRVRGRPGPSSPRLELRGPLHPSRGERRACLRGPSVCPTQMSRTSVAPVGHFFKKQENGPRFLHGDVRAPGSSSPELVSHELKHCEQLRVRRVSGCREVQLAAPWTET